VRRPQVVAKGSGYRRNRARMQEHAAAGNTRRNKDNGTAAAWYGDKRARSRCRLIFTPMLATFIIIPPTPDGFSCITRLRRVSLSTATSA